MCRKTYLTILTFGASVGFLYFFSITAQSSLPAPDHPLLFGYYYVDSQYGDFKNEIKDYTNTQIILEESWIRPPNVSQQDIQNLNSAFDETITLGHKIVYHVAKNPNDWKQSIELTKSYWQNIEFIYLADEPNWSKIETENYISNFERLVSQAGLSKKRIAINYTPQQIQSGASYQANNLDIIGFEAYVDPAKQNDASIVADLNGQINSSKQKIGNKKMFLVIQGYDRNGAWTNLNTLKDIQIPPYLKSYNDPNVVGLFIFSYARPGGTQSLPLLQTEHQNIWTAISGTGSAPPPVLITNQNTKNLGAGTFPDVAWHNGRFWVAAQLGSPGQTVSLYSYAPDLSDQKLEKTFNLGPNALAFPRLSSYNGILWLAYRDGGPSYGIKLWRSDTNSTEVLGPGGGNDPTALGEGLIAWQDGSFNIYTRSLTGGSTTQAGQGAPTGLSRISNSQIITVDQDNNLVSWGTRAWVVGSLIIAEGPAGGVVGEINGQQFTVLTAEETFTPHAAVSPDGNYAIVTWGRTGVRITAFTGPAPSPVDLPPDDGGQPFDNPKAPGIPTEGLPGFGQLVSLIFTWSLNILGTVVFVMIFYAGFMWFTAAGNTAQVNEARGRITNAITGAIILLAAYIILYTINPDLVGGTFTLPGLGTNNNPNRTFINSQLASNTQEIQRLADDYQNSSGPAASQIKTNLDSALNTRSNLINQALTVQNSPDLVWDNLLDSGTINKLPPDSANLAERPATINNARLTTIISEDFSGRQATYEHKISNGNQNLDLYIAEDNAPQVSGQIGNINGYVLGSNSFITRSVGQSTGMTSANASGDEKMLVVLVNMDNSASGPFSPSQIRDMAFNGSALAFYKEASGNSFSFSGDVVGWIPITVANKMSPLNPDTFFQGSGSGIDTSGYDIITFIAAGSICGTSPTCGLATLGKDTLNGQPMGFIWLMGDVAQYADSYSSHPFTWTKFDYLLAHELGHVLSLYHAEATINCLGIFDACGTQGYGNVYDIMGQPQNAVHFNAHAREKLGWSNAPTQIAASGRYTLGSLQFGDSARFSANSREFLIEFRESIGFDSSLPPGVLLVNNLTQLGFSPALVDLAPSSPEFFLSPGDRISDSGVEISFISISSGQAIFDITLPGSPPTSSPQPQPTSTFTPATPTPTPNPSNASGTIRGYYSPNPLGDGRKGIVLDYTTTNIANTSPPSDGATIERNAAEIATIAESNLDLPAGTKIDFDPPSGTHTYTLLHWPSRDELARVRVTVPSSSPQPTSTFTPTPTLTPTPTPTSTPTQTQTPTPVPTATAIPTPAPQPGSAITQCDDDQNTCLTVQYWPVGSGGCHTELEPCVVFNHQIDEGDILGGYNNGGAIIRMDQADIFLLQPSDNDLPAGTRIQSPAPSSGFYSYMLHDAGQGNTAQQNSLLPRPIRLQIP